MRFLAIGLMISALCAYPAELTKSERDYAMSQLHASRKRFIDSLQSVSAAQWKFKAAPDRWSIAEVAEHIALSESMLFGLSQKILGMPVNADQKSDPKADSMIWDKVTDRSVKASAPEMLKPANKYKDAAAALADFKTNRDKAIRYVETTKDDLRGHTMKQGNDVQDAYQYLLLMAAHTERHVRQIEEVKADAKYPK